MIFLLSTSIFSTVTLLLVGLLLFVEAKIVKKGPREILINDDEDKKLVVDSGISLLSALVDNGILIPSACGGKGSCGTCKCTVEEGGGDYLPTELTHISRKEKADQIRIACQLKVKDNLKVRVPEEIFSIKKYSATVESNKNVATFIKELVLRLDPKDTLEFKAGAFIQIDIPEYETQFSNFEIQERFKDAWGQYNLWGIAAKADEPVYRAYSLANPPYEKNILKFTIRIATPPSNALELPPGVGSSYVFNLKVGDKVTLSGPYGDFFVKETKREMCFIGGGAGMAPMRCHILDLLNAVKTDRIITFWYGARSKSEMFYDDEFTELANKNDNFTYNVALSAPDKADNWKGFTGYIHQYVDANYLKNHSDPTEIEYYLCGPPMMIDAIIKMLDDYGVEPEMIAYDKF